MKLSKYVSTSQIGYVVVEKKINKASLNIARVVMEANLISRLLYTSWWEFMC